MDEEDICVNGICTDRTDSEGFHECDCFTNYKPAGDPATMSLTCIGRFLALYNKYYVQLLRCHN